MPPRRRRRRQPLPLSLVRRTRVRREEEEKEPQATFVAPNPLIQQELSPGSSIWRTWPRGLSFNAFETNYHQEFSFLSSSNLQGIYRAYVDHHREQQGMVPIADNEFNRLIIDYPLAPPLGGSWPVMNPTPSPALTEAIREWSATPGLTFDVFRRRHLELFRGRGDMIIQDYRAYLNQHRALKGLDAITVTDYQKVLRPLKSFTEYRRIGPAMYRNNQQSLCYRHYLNRRRQLMGQNLVTDLEWEQIISVPISEEEKKQQVNSSDSSESDSSDDEEMKSRETVTVPVGSSPLSSSSSSSPPPLDSRPLTFNEYLNMHSDQFYHPQVSGDRLSRFQRGYRVYLNRERAREGLGPIEDIDFDDELNRHNDVDEHESTDENDRKESSPLSSRDNEWLDRYSEPHWMIPRETTTTTTILSTRLQAQANILAHNTGRIVQELTGGVQTTVVPSGYQSLRRGLRYDEFTHALSTQPWQNSRVSLNCHLLHTYQRYLQHHRDYSDRSSFFTRIQQEIGCTLFDIEQAYNGLSSSLILHHPPPTPTPTAAAAAAAPPVSTSILTDRIVQRDPELHQPSDEEIHFMIDSIIHDPIETESVFPFLGNRDENLLFSHIVVYKEYPSANGTKHWGSSCQQRSTWLNDFWSSECRVPRCFLREKGILVPVEPYIWWLEDPIAIRNEVRSHYYDILAKYTERNKKTLEKMKSLVDDIIHDLRPITIPPFLYSPDLKNIRDTFVYYQDNGDNWQYIISVAENRSVFRYNPRVFTKAQLKFINVALPLDSWIALPLDSWIPGNAELKPLLNKYWILKSAYDRVLNNHDELTMRFIDLINGKPSWTLYGIPIEKPLEIKSGPRLHPPTIIPPKNSWTDTEWKEEKSSIVACSICAKNVSCVLYNPCGHSSFCLVCTHQWYLMEEGNRDGVLICPMCKGDVKECHRLIV